MRKTKRVTLSPFPPIPTSRGRGQGVRVALTICFLLIIPFLSCSRNDLRLFSPSTYFPDEKEGVGLITFKNDTPENVLENLKLAYNKRNYKLYQELISTDFRFYMSPSYFGSINNGTIPPPDPAYWTAELDTSGQTVYYKTYSQEMETIRKMFDPAGNAKDIALSFTYDFLKYLNGPDSVVYTLRNIELTITIRDPYMIVTARDGVADLTELTIVKGIDDLWKITKWKDFTLGSEDAL